MRMVILLLILVIALASYAIGQLSVKQFTESANFRVYVSMHNGKYTVDRYGSKKFYSAKEVDDFFAAGRRNE